MSKDDFVPAESLFAKKFQLLDHVRLNSKAYNIERTENSSGWNMWITVRRFLDEGSLYCDKLIATGLTSWPNVPSLPHDNFKLQTFHFQELGVRHILHASPEAGRCYG